MDVVAKDSGEDHLDVLEETVVAIVVAVQTNMGEVIQGTFGFC